MNYPHPPKHQRRVAGGLLEKIVEVKGVLEAQHVASGSHVPIGMGQQALCFADDAFDKADGSGVASHFLHRPVQVVDVHRQLINEVLGRFRGSARVGDFHRK